ncbi:MAG: slipin family protein [Myxococcota bacterium]
MFKSIHVPLHERAVVLRNGLPIRALGPGRHHVWGLSRRVQRWDTRGLVFDAHAQVRDVLDPSWFSEVSIAANERGVLFVDGRPARFLRPGVVRYWTVDKGVELRLYSIDEPMPVLSRELASLIPSAEYVQREVFEHQRGLEFIAGRFERVVEPGSYARWSQAGAQVELALIDMRRQQLTLSGQELMTRDKVSLRLTLSVEYAVEDPVKVAAVANGRDSVYLAVQLAARAYVAGVTLDALLEGREAMDAYLFSETAPKAAAFGVVLHAVGVKDIVLPGEMKALLNRVIEAQKEAAANVILRREEAASTKSLAQTAKVMADHPVLLRLKELDALKEIAGQIDDVSVLVGEGGLQSLLPAALKARS